MNSEKTTTTTYPPSPTVTVGIKSVRDQVPALINGSSTLDLPFCYTGQPIVLTIPQEQFVGASSIAITDYIWQVPTGWQALNASPSPYHQGGFLGGRSITLVAPTGTTGGLVRASQYSRACNENSSFQNAPGALISNARELLIRRPLPTITGIAASRTTLTCGDQRPLTLTANTSQQGATSFTWSLPAGWSFAPGSTTTGASVLVVPTGSGGGTVSATATYNCAGYTTAAGSTSIGYDPRLPAPTISPLPASGATGIPGLCGPLMLTATAAGATEYYWSATDGILINGAPTATVAAGDSVTLTPPAGGAIGRGQVIVC